jgi:hypothetical protein
MPTRTELKYSTLSNTIAQQPTGCHRSESTHRISSTATKAPFLINPLTSTHATHHFKTPPMDLRIKNQHIQCPPKLRNILEE